MDVFNRNARFFHASHLLLDKLFFKSKQHISVEIVDQVDFNFKAKILNSTNL